MPKHGYDFPMAANTATMVLYYPKTNEVLLGLRSKDSDAFPSRWSLPGGYLNVGTETLKDAATRETKEETGLEVAQDRWELFFVDDEVGSDPRYTHVINLCYFVHVNDDEYEKVQASDDLDDVAWTTVGRGMGINLPFNHNEILREFSKTL